MVVNGSQWLKAELMPSWMLSWCPADVMMYLFLLKAAWPSLEAAAEGRSPSEGPACCLLLSFSPSSWATLWKTFSFFGWSMTSRSLASSYPSLTKRELKTAQLLIFHDCPMECPTRVTVPASTWIAQSIVQFSGSHLQLVHARFLSPLQQKTHLCSIELQLGWWGRPVWGYAWSDAPWVSDAIGALHLQKQVSGPIENISPTS